MEYKKVVEVTRTGMVMAEVTGSDGKLKGLEFFQQFITTNKAVERDCKKAHKWADERIAICLRQEAHR